MRKIFSLSLIGKDVALIVAIPFLLATASTVWHVTTWSQRVAFTVGSGVVYLFYRLWRRSYPRCPECGSEHTAHDTLSPPGGPAHFRCLEKGCGNEFTWDDIPPLANPKRN